MNVALRPQPLNIISLCTGGGGLDLGVELAMPSARTVCMVEREAFAIGHLVAAMQQGLMGQAPIWSNARTFNGRPWRGIVDGVIGGIPCQPHSLAGKRLGEEDERDLWSAARRIIVQSGAWFALIENVAGMLSSGGAERVFRDFRRMGFEVEGGLFTASEVGASHERERVFILAVTDRMGHANHARLERHGQYGERPGEWSPWQDGLELVDTTGIGRREGRTKSDLRSGRDTASRSDDAMGDSVSCRHDGRQDDAIGRSLERAFVEGPSERVGLFPPGPSDLHSWRHTLERAPELEPAFRRVVDGLASRLDTARVDRLRLLGNGVVSLEGAYAFRTLATRLAATGSAGAIRLVRGMEIAMETA